jgi:glutamine---fructose-6-phosphate transaminase (isomerizing)
MIAARKGSPLAIGHGDGEMFVGSDAIALAPLTDRITYLEEGDRAVSPAPAPRSSTPKAGAPTARSAGSSDQTRVDKAGHAFHGQGDRRAAVVIGALRIAHYVPRRGRMRSPARGAGFPACDRVTWSPAAPALRLHGREILVRAARRLPVEVDIASEFRYREPCCRRGGGRLRQPVGRDRRHAGRAAPCAGRSRGRVGGQRAETSSIAREATWRCRSWPGPEIGVASTKAFTCQLTVLALLALKAGRTAGGSTTRLGRLAACARLPGLMNHALDRAARYRASATKLAEARDVLFLGRGRCIRWRWKAR